ncbi:GxxExxY protein, partial [Bacteroidales bacterium OttesenSCG-928-K22]|nr:GxxExxY protein [Bacteroidales bacterium OttesenSCG-928-K22]
MDDINDIIKLIIKSSYKIYNNLGAGFLEKVYEKALLIELKEL